MKRQLITLVGVLSTVIILVRISRQAAIRKAERENRYMTIECYKPGRLGNQIWMFFSGWSVAKTLGRKFYYNCEPPMMDDIDLLKWMFPKIAGEFEIIKPLTETSVKLVEPCHAYEDPSVYNDITDKYLKVDINFAQNARYTVKYHDQIREIMEFGANMTDIGEAVIRNLTETRKINVDNLLCAHIRQTDFAELGWGRTYEENILAIGHVARLQTPRTLFIMGDDTNFMERLVEDLVKNGDVAKDSFHSTFKREVDMYLSKQLCKTVVMTTERTTFGFWLAFLMGNDQEVFYLKEYRQEVPRFDDKFPLPWHAIKVEKSTSVLLN